MSIPLSLNADLHCHSVVSDGTLTPEELALRAHQNGVHLWSLTDHDVLGGQERARQAALNLGMDYLSGVEISISWMGQTVHIVGLGFDTSNPILQRACVLRAMVGKSELAKWQPNLRKLGLKIVMRAPLSLLVIQSSLLVRTLHAF